MQPLEKTPQHPVRLTEQMIDYWHALKGDRALPLEEEVDPQTFGDAWNHCFLVQVRESGVYAYSYLGSALIDAYGDDLTGHEVSEALVYPHPEGLFAQFQRV